jgi:inositol phosphorylceramide mannosyltransferase catalytic subunit
MSPTGPIPKRIIQTGKSKSLSLAEQAAAVNLTLLNPGFEYVYFDDNDVVDFMNREFPQYKTVFDSFPYKIQRFDFFRYLAVFRLGGFYFDLDVFLARSITELLPVTCVFPFEELTINPYLRTQLGTDWEIGNYAFGAAAGHPFLELIIENCVRAQREPRWTTPMTNSIPRMFRADYEVLNSTGPGMITRTLAENPAVARNVHVLFPDNVCDEKTWHKFGHYGVHMMAASWRKRGSYVRRRLGLLWESRTRRRLLEQSLKLGPRRPIALPAGV